MINVAIGIIYNTKKNAILIARHRKCQKTLLWEFPGGKIELNEDPKSGLKRELYEELGIIPVAPKRFRQFEHYDQHAQKLFRLHVWIIFSWDGCISNKEGQQLIWVPVHKLQDYRFLDANHSLIKQITWPQLYLISPTDFNSVDCIKRLESCYRSGLRLFQIRIAGRQKLEFSDLITETKMLSDQYGVILILNGTPEDLNNHDVDGIHLKSKYLFQYQTRPVGMEYRLGASCHSEQEIEQAMKLEVDYIFISPVCHTKTHIYQPALGWHKFQHLCQGSHSPVYALGGLSPEDINTATFYGGHGIATISGIWQHSR